MDLISLLVAVLILGLICYLVQIIPMAAPFRLAAQIIVVVIAIVYLLNLLHGGHGVYLK